MACSLFGKLPAKRDFVAVGMPRELMRFWEVWLQGGLSASQQALGTDWRDIYLHAPIWRFWLGREHLGQEVMGAFMPSLDGVGRFFPLAVMVQAPAGQAFPAPGENDQQAWFDAVETFLLDTLEPGASYDATLAALAGLGLPETVARDDIGTTRPRGLVGVTGRDGEPDMPALIARLEAADQVARRHAGSYWWSIGGESFPAMALHSPGVPQAHDFAVLLTGPAPTAEADSNRAEDEQVAEIGAEP
jgi:type VI secretion system protein ImpM